MNIKIYQNTKNLETCFMSLEENTPVNSADYEQVFEGKVNCKDLEEVFECFNTCADPQFFHGHSLSTSDIVYVEEEEQYYYCDSLGWEKIEFNPEEAVSRDLLRVVLVRPSCPPVIAYIRKGLKGSQKVVDGYIECTSCQGLEIVCNDEGKFNGMGPNRPLFDEDGEMYDIVYGPFFIPSVNLEEGEFISITKEDEEKAMKLFSQMYVFINRDLDDVEEDEDE